MRYQRRLPMLWIDLPSGSIRIYDGSSRVSLKILAASAIMAAIICCLIR